MIALDGEYERERHRSAIDDRLAGDPPARDHPGDLEVGRAHGQRPGDPSSGLGELEEGLPIRADTAVGAGEAIGVRRAAETQGQECEQQELSRHGLSDSHDQVRAAVAMLL